MCAFLMEQIKPSGFFRAFVSSELAEGNTEKAMNAGESWCSVSAHRKQDGMLSTTGEIREPKNAEVSNSGAQTLSLAFINPLTGLQML